METWVDSALKVVLILMAVGPGLLLLADAGSGGRKTVALCLLALSLLGYFGLTHTTGLSTPSYAEYGAPGDYSE